MTKAAACCSCLTPTQLTDNFGSSRPFTFDDHKFEKSTLLNEQSLESVQLENEIQFEMKLPSYGLDQRDEQEWALLFAISAFVLASPAVGGCCRT